VSNEETESNDHITVVVTRKPHCQIHFDIKVAPDSVEVAYQTALKRMNKEITLPGFRKGRAPEAMILERYSSTVQKECLDLVLKTSFSEALHLTHLHPLTDREIKPPLIHHCNRKEGAHFSVEFEGRPLIPSVKLEKLHIPQAPRPPLTEEERDNALHNLLLKFATYDRVEHRPAQEDDFVDLSIELLEDPPREVIKNQRTEVNRRGLPSWLRQKVIGLQGGESVEGMTEQDPALSQSSTDFRSAPFRLTLHSIWEGRLPLADEAFAKRVGLSSVEELHQKINQRLAQQVEEGAFRSEVDAIERLLVKKYPIDLPQSLIDSDKKARLNDYLQSLEREKIEYSEEDSRQIERSIEEISIFGLQLFFLFQKIAADNNITVDPKEVEQELARELALSSLAPKGDDMSYAKKLSHRIHNALLERKVKRFLVDSAIHIGEKTLTPHIE